MSNGMNGNGAETAMREPAAAAGPGLLQVEESARMLELALQSADWRMLGWQSDQEFTRAGLRDITDFARIMRMKNPVIRRGVEVKRLYVWAQGVTITAKDRDINGAIQAFWDDERNVSELTDHQALGQKETFLTTDGNAFFQLFVNRATGGTRVRTIEPNEINRIICNPDDSKEPWYYERTFLLTEVGGAQRTVTEYYPDFRYTPTARPATLNGHAVQWERPVYHVATNRLTPSSPFGVSEIYPALDWAMAYKSFLENLATVWKALARFAWEMKLKGGSSAVAAAKTALNTTVGSTGMESNPSPLPGSTFIGGSAVEMKPMSTGGATMKADDGRRLFLMAASVFGFPETFWGDASVGTLATAKALDRPTELLIEDRQRLWQSVLRTILRFVLLNAVKYGPLRAIGRIESVPDGDQVTERVVWDGDIDSTVEITFPSVVEHDIASQVSAIVDAQTMKGGGGGIPLETAVRMLLTELGVQDVDAVLDLWREDRDAQADAAQDGMDVAEMLREAATALKEAHGVNAE